MYTPPIFEDDPLLKRRIILYLSVHGFKFQDLYYDVRITCPDFHSVYIYCSRSKTLLHLYDKKGDRVYNKRPIKVTGFLESICHYILPQHCPSLSYHVCKIPYIINLKNDGKK